MASTGVTIKVGLAGAAATRRDADSTGRSIHKIGSEAETTGHKMKLAELSTKSWERSSEKLKDVVKDLAGVVGIAGIGLGVGEFVKASIDAQTSQIKLQQTLKNSGLSWGRYGEEIEKATDKTAMRTGFSPAQVTDSLTNLVRTTHDVRKAQKLNNTVLDLARTKNMSLAGASSIVARVYNGNFKGLNRLGLQVTAVTTEQDALRDSGKKYTRDQLARAKADDLAVTKTTALTMVTKAFHGQASKFASGTLQGQIGRLKSTLEVIQNDVARVVLPSMTAGAKKLSDLAGKLVENWPRISATIGRDADKVKAKLSPLIKFIGQHKKGVAEFAGAFAALAVSLKTISKFGKVTGLSKVTSAVTRNGVVGRVLGITKADGSITRPFYVVTLDKAPKSTTRKIADAAKKLAGPLSTAAGAGGDLGALGALGLGSSAFVAGGGLTYLALTHDLNLPTRGRRASSPSNPAGHIPFVPGPLQRSTTPNSAAVRQAAGGGTAAHDPLGLAALAILNGGLVVHNNNNVSVKLPNGKELARAVTHSANKAKALK